MHPLLLAVHNKDDLRCICLPALFGLVVVVECILRTLPSFGCVLTILVGIVTVVGTLKGYDQLMNLVLDDVKELLRGTSVLH